MKAKKICMSMFGLGCYGIFLFLIVLTALGGEEEMEKNKVALRIIIVKTETFAEDSTIRVLIENTGKDNITVLKEFNPRPVFFQFSLIKSDETPIDSPGAGKVDFGSPMKYITLETGEFVGITMSLKDVYKELQNGKYQLSIRYHNQYGVNCFRGSLDSNVIHLEIDGNVNRPTSSKK